MICLLCGLMFCGGFAVVGDRHGKGVLGLVLLLDCC